MRHNSEFWSGTRFRQGIRSGRPGWGKYALVSLIAGVTLAGCGLDIPEDAPQPGSASAARPQSNAGGGLGFLAALNAPKSGTKTIALQTKVALANGDVIVDAPAGWCIEPKSLKARGRGGFALLAGCRALTEGKSGPFVPPGALSVTVWPRRPAGEVIATDALRAIIPDAVILEQQMHNGVVLMRMQSGQAATETDLGEPHWRAVFVHGGHMVSLAAFGPKNGEIAGRGGSMLLADVAAGIRTAQSGAGGNSGDL
ncbi:hypothetical protein Q4577_09740 [Marinovum sp. 2_MG-2023]|uniref:hypothetical protein n=1 Tax=Marinovum sp. 1_MG-2023 TaxID=3062633 RepID=UPI0026E2B0A4|nr:hypothetical protein [Marinovum sp. 1_MG-2023]MDO6730301.1 hypothetical protein [Marinovum sp. 2_MG-2023]MDO6779039.1 hypothetical protein [Marinovum sp. 1_MG-2023]